MSRKATRKESTTSTPALMMSASSKFTASDSQLSPNGSVCSSPNKSFGGHSPLLFRTVDGKSSPIGKTKHCNKSFNVPRKTVPHLHGQLLKQSNEEILTELYFNKDSKLLLAFCKSLIGRNDFSNYHIRILLKFYKSRGKLTDLLITLAENEIETSNPQNELFRGNSIFTRVYAEYLRNYCSQFLQSVIQPIEELIFTTKTRQSPGLPTSDENRSNVFVSSLLRDVLIVFSETLVDAIDQLPPHLRLILRHIFQKVLTKRGEDSACHVFETLLFLRFLLPPLSTTPQLLKQIQLLLKSCTGKILFVHSIDNDNSLCKQEESSFIHSVNVLYRNIVFGPLSYGISAKGVKRVEQDESYHDMINVLRSELNKISSHYGDGFEVVFNLIKGKREVSHINILTAAEGMTDWMIEREIQVEVENKELRTAIDRLERSCQLLRQKICDLQDSDCNVSAYM
ncbi:Ras GTPase-activating protein [Entamoeba marina]